MKQTVSIHIQRERERENSDICLLQVCYVNFIEFVPQMEIGNNKHRKEGGNIVEWSRALVQNQSGQS